MQFRELCEYFEKIEGTSKRLIKTEILATLLRKIEPDEVRCVVNLALGQLASAYERIEFNLAEKMLIRAIAQSYGRTLPEITALYKEIGDVGELVRQVSETAKLPINKVVELRITDVYVALVKIAREKGTGSIERKVLGLITLLKASTPTEAKYIVRMVNESLRLGFSDSTILDVFSYFIGGNKEHSMALEKIYQMRPDIALLGEEVVTLGIEHTLNGAGIKLGIPVIPALAQRLGSVDEMIEKMGVVYVEPKLDGTRVQIQYSSNRVENKESTNQQTMFEEEKPKIWVKTFTRNLDENTAQFPELWQIGEQLLAKEVILDAEAVGYDPESGKLLPFQMTITRKRKHAISEVQKNIPLRFFVFDVLYLDGESLIEEPLVERRKKLERIIKPGKVLALNEYIETSDATIIRAYHQKQLEKGLEGILVKKKEGKYEPGRAGFNWVKLKEVEQAEGKLSDTIDCVVMGYYGGKGKRNDFGIGAFLVGIRGEEDKIVTLAKIGTGLSDEQFRELYQKLERIKFAEPDPAYVVDKNLTPDYWVLPSVVVEVAADEITKSPIHSAGYALRFPRLVKFREDKGVGQITDKKEIVEMAKIALEKYE